MTELTTLSRSIEGQVAFITGCASGMGRATARVFAEAGAHVAACDIDLEGAQQTVSDIQGAGKSARAWQLDVADQDAVAATIQSAAEHFGGIDLLINNAGISRPTPIDADGYPETWDRVVAVLLSAHTYTVRAALPHLRRSENPRIINIASTEGLGATPGSSPYSAAKHGVIGLTRSLAVELGKEGITVNAICPGPINTAMTEAISDEHKQVYARRRTALRRYGSPEEVAQTTLSLCLPAAAFVTGVALPVDGGLTIRRA